MKVLVKGSLPLVTINVPVPNITSWKTTLVGIASLFVAGMQTYNEGLQPALHDPKVWLFVLVGIGNMFAKDSNVTGGTKAATPEAHKRVEEAPKPPSTLLAP